MHKIQYTTENRNKIKFPNIAFNLILLSLSARSDISYTQNIESPSTNQNEFKQRLMNSDYPAPSDKVRNRDVRQMF